MIELEYKKSRPVKNTSPQRILREVSKYDWTWTLKKSRPEASSGPRGKKGEELPGMI